MREREIIAARVEREEQWAYDRRAERLSLRQIAKLTQRAPRQGELGYPLSEGSREDAHRRLLDRTHGSLATGVDACRARHEAEIDELIRLAMGDILAARTAEDVKASAEAEARLLRYREREAKISGTGAPQRIETEATTKGAVAAELDAMLSRVPRPS